MSPRVAIGGLQHETNTFARLQTTLDDFITAAAWPGLTEGAALFDVFETANIPISGFIAAAGDWELVPLLWAQAEPGGYVEQSAFDNLSDRLLKRIKVAGAIDAIYLDLHGAMVSREHPDAEAELLLRIRHVVGDSLPIAVSLDLHGNLSPEFFELASCVAIYRTYPHIDMADTGARAQRLLSLLLESGKPFASAMRQLDYLIPITAQSTMREPAKGLYSDLQTTPEGVISADIALGFPPADIPDNGASVLVYGVDQKAVDNTADDILLALQNAEKQFHNPLLTTNEAVLQAIKLATQANKPVVIADPQDNPGAGGTGNTTGILRALIESGARNAALSMMWDPETAAQAHAAGEGQSIKIVLGGESGQQGNLPLQLQATVEQLSDGVFEFSGAMYQGSTGRLGQCARLLITGLDGTDTTSEVRVVVVSVRCQNADLALFSAFGIDPLQQNILVVKSAIHFLDAYEPIAETVLFAKAQGDNPCVLEELPFTQLRPELRIGPTQDISRT